MTDRTLRIYASQAAVRVHFTEARRSPGVQADESRKILTLACGTEVFYRFASQPEDLTTLRGQAFYDIYVAPECNHEVRAAAKGLRVYERIAPNPKPLVAMVNDVNARAQSVPLGIISSVTVIDAKAGDTILLKTEHKLSAEQLDRVREHFAKAVPGVRILIMPPGLEMVAHVRAPQSAPGNVFGALSSMFGAPAGHIDANLLAGANDITSNRIVAQSITAKV